MARSNKHTATDMQEVTKIQRIGACIQGRPFIHRLNTTMVVHKTPHLRNMTFINIPMKSFLFIYEAVKTTINNQVEWWRVDGKGHLGVSRCVLREWVVRGGGLDGYFGDQGLPVVT